MDDAKFVYAVFKGKNPGIYLTWNECQEQVTGFAGAVFRKCRGIKSAKFFAQHGRLETEKEKIKAKTVKESELRRVSEFPAPSADDEDPIIVYVDGSAKKDKEGFTSGGFGVWFSDGDERNCKEAFHLPNPTNNRCELMAAIKAIELTSTKKSDLSRELIICSDSHYAWDCMGWITGWKMHNWKTTNGTEVKNRGLIEKLWKGCQDRKPGHCLGFRT